MRQPRRIRVALAGNPNSGKTSIFNALTGGRQHVGNYAGVTVEKRVGSCVADGERFDVIDLPGTYSLSSYSPEERIAQEELLEGELDVVVAVVDSTALERSLVLLTQLIQIGANPVLCLNMSDEAERAGQKLDTRLLVELLGFPVVETVGHKAIGADELKAAIRQAASSPVTGSRLVLGERLDGALRSIDEKLSKTAVSAASRSWVASKLFVNDDSFVEKVRGAGRAGEAAVAEADAQRAKIEAATNLDANLFVMERCYGFVNGLLREVRQRRSREDARALSDGIDSILVNRALGLPVFLAVMYAVFWVTFTLGELPMGWIESGFAALGGGISGLWPEGSDSHLRSLLVDGIIGGVGGVVVFLPNIILLFLCLALLEDTGYLARAAFLMDRFMHRFGLHGRSFIPMMTGFGCSIPGIMATRTLENERDRLTTMLVLPLMSCGARLPIWMLLIPAFFPAAWRAPMLWLVYMVGVVLALALALLLRKSILRGDDAPFVMELPPYRLPTGRAVGARMIERSWLYLRKAGTIILGISILMWFITAYPAKDHYRVDEEIASGRVRVVEVEDALTPPGVEVITAEERENRRAAEDLRHSVAGRIGSGLETVLRPLGFDWRIGTGLIGAFAAKEVFVAQMGIVYSMGETEEGSRALQAALRRDYPPLVGFCLMLFLLVTAPCMATIAVTRRESGSWRWALLQLGGLTVIGYALTLVVYQVGRLLV